MGFQDHPLEIYHRNQKLNILLWCFFKTYKSRLTVVSREAKEEVPCDSLSMNAREYFTRTNLDKIKNAPTDEP